MSDHQVICDICQTPITGGQVAKYGGEPVHPDCIPVPETLDDIQEEDPIP